eukprot:GEMP01015671.1.p1 GENE.GEMP01015671.1~~GEMP01015671.1.p1  ORF type:complete len:249 (+),score=41.88 GEMP01015671.1:21-767(+)
MGTTCSSCTSKVDTDALRKARLFGGDNRITSLTEKDANEAVDVVTNALISSSEPSIRFIFGAVPAAHSARSYAWWVLQNAFRSGTVWGFVDDGKLKGVMCLRKPNDAYDAYTADWGIRFFRQVFFRLEHQLPDEATQRRFDLVQTEAQKIYHTQLASLKAHWFLEMIAVNPEFKEQEIGDAFLTVLSLVADNGRHPVYVKCAGDEMAGYFKKRGFQSECAYFISREDEKHDESLPPLDMHALTRWPKL